MRGRVRRGEHVLIGTVALVFVFGLLAVHAMWPGAFAVFVAIGGAAGALMVLYEVRLTKRIAQAEFLRDLQTSFASDHNICELWRKLLLDEPISRLDRPLVSSYLTFFETLHLLLRDGTLSFRMADDLFRNRFFTAVGNRDVQSTALVKEAGSFANIHELIADWHDHLVTSGLPIHKGYYSYVTAIVEAKGFTLAWLAPDDLDDLLGLQRRVIEGLDTPEVLRENSSEMFVECLSHHRVLGAFADGELAGAAILYDGGGSDENIKHHLTSDPDELASAVNLKLVLVDPRHRRSGLGRSLVELLHREATEASKSEILCTIHRTNQPSRRLFTSLGFAKVQSVVTPYGKRDVYRRKLALPDLQWAR